MQFIFGKDSTVNTADAYKLFFRIVITCAQIVSLVMLERSGYYILRNTIYSYFYLFFKKHKQLYML